MSFVELRREEVQRMKEQQIYFIEYGFNEVIKKLEEKRDQLKEEFTAKYTREEERFAQKQEILEVYNRDQASIEAIYDDLSRFIERGSDVKVLGKITDITEFIHKSIENLEHISKAKGFEKEDMAVDPQLKPLSLHVQKVFDLCIL